MKILTESEDHATRGTYTINLAVSGSTNNDPTDGSRDYDYTKTTATAASQQLPQSGNEGPVELALDNNSTTFWHTKWSEYLENSPEKRWIQLELAEATMLDAAPEHRSQRYRHRVPGGSEHDRRGRLLDHRGHRHLGPQHRLEDRCVQ